MNKELVLAPDKLAVFQKQLLSWYDEEKRPLPWRTTNSPYKIWVSEVMLQQTQVKKVLEYYERFLRLFPDIPTLAGADLDGVLKAWEGLGYYARARNLHKAAREIAEKYDGVIPETYDALTQIKGIGPYTAAAVSSIAFGEEKAVVDGNVIRVLARLFQIEDYPKQTEILRQIQEAAQALLEPSRAGDHNQAVMELGATVCSPRKPKCLLCPVSNFCRAYGNMPDPSSLPVKAVRKKTPHYDIAVGVIWDEGYVFIDKRLEEGLLGGLWEFPGGKIEAGETAQQAVKREIKEEFSLDVEVGDFLMEVKHAYTHFRITLHVYHCLYRGGEPMLNAATDWQWVKPEELSFYAFPAANKKVIAKLLADFAAPRPNAPN